MRGVIVCARRLAGYAYMICRQSNAEARLGRKGEDRIKDQRKVKVKVGSRVSGRVVIAYSGSQKLGYLDVCALPANVDMYNGHRSPAFPRQPRARSIGGSRGQVQGGEPKARIGVRGSKILNT